MTIASSFDVSKEFSRFLEEENLIAHKERIDDILKRFRGVRGGLIPVLQQVQNAIKFIPPVVQDYIAHGLGIPSSDVFGVVSFYSFFSMVPKGKNIIKVCLGTACYVKGADKIIDKIGRDVGIRLGETTEDRRFTLEGVRCLGACGLAPVCVVNEDTHGLVDSNKIIKILDSYE